MLRLKNKGQYIFVLCQIIILIFSVSLNAKGSPSGVTIPVGSDRGMPNIADMFGDVVGSYTNTMGFDTHYKTTEDTVEMAVESVYGDTISQPNPEDSLYGETVWVDLDISNQGNTADSFTINTIEVSMKNNPHPITDSVTITYYDSQGLNVISHSDIVNADDLYKFKAAIYLHPDIPTDDTLIVQVKAVAQSGHGGETEGYIGFNGNTYCGNGDDTTVLSVYVLSSGGIVGERPLGRKNLIAIPIDNSKVRLEWTPVPSMDVAKYYIYCDSGTGIMDWNAPIDTVIVPTTVWTSGILTHDSNYQFGVKAVDDSGMFDNRYSVIVAILRDIINTSKPSAEITYPFAGDLIKGNYVGVHSKLIYGSLNDIESVYFEYSTDSGITWNMMDSYKPVNYPNPVTDPTTDNEFVLLWDINNLSNGYYLVRTVAADLNGDTDIYPVLKWIEIGGDNNSADDMDWPDNYSDSSGDWDRTAVKIYNSVDNSIDLDDPNKTNMDNSIVIPEGALSSDVDQVIATYSDTQINSTLFNFAGEYIDLGLRSGNTQFNSYIDLYIHYKDDDNNLIVDGTNISVYDLKIYYLDNNDNKWYEISSELNINNKEVHGRTNHFTLYAIGSPATSTNVNLILVFPNPYKPYDGNSKTGLPYGKGNALYPGGVMFSNVPANTRISIYTILGEKVSEINTVTGGNVIWDAKNQSGREVASGVYIWVAEGKGGRKTGNIVIVR